MFYLKRFLNAQEFGGLYDDMPNYDTALQEIKNGHKKFKLGFDELASLSVDIENLDEKKK